MQLAKDREKYIGEFRKWIKDHVIPPTLNKMKIVSLSFTLFL